MSVRASAVVKAMLGPTNTGKTHYAIERLCAHTSGIMGFPLRLLAREVYDRVVAIKGAGGVGLITGEERIMPPGARWLLCTAESMPLDREVSFLALDEAQLGIDPERGHVFTDRLLHARGRDETLILGSSSLAPVIRALVPEAEIMARPRFSRLSYAGPKKISRLPPRTAIIAFSADDVYAIAEQVRRHCGGAAIVMGNLSPRTRNAQVAMYQSGEVDYIVATDAIGMGLNMDIGHVAFASLSKFDGSRRRRLSIPEMAQIAGRAGRHQRDGTFGVVLGAPDAPEFSQEEIERIEDHRFRALSWLYWRNSNLEFDSPEALLASLEALLPAPELRPAPEADDHAVLRNLAVDEEVRSLTKGEALTRRLWDACGLPDFRNTGPEFHARLVGRLYKHLAGDDRHIPTKMIADELVRLDSVQGNIPTLASRLAAVRTWTYVANRSDWLQDPATWAARSREVEDKLSDALHKQLTERFVDRRNARLIRDGSRKSLPGDFVVEENGTVRLLDEPVGTLSGFRFTPDPKARSDGRRQFLAQAETRLPAELAKRASTFAQAADSAMILRLQPGEQPSIIWLGGDIAQLKRGRDLLRPELVLDLSIARLDPQLRTMIQRRCATFLQTQISQRLKPLEKLNEIAFSPQSPPGLRAALAPLAEEGGVIARRELHDLLATLSPEDRRMLRRQGWVVGSLALFHPLLIKPAAIRLRLALRAARANAPMPPLPMPGLGLLDGPSVELSEAAEVAGYVRLGNQMLRLDLLERIAQRLHDQRKGFEPFEPNAALATSLGVGAETLDRLMRALGFVPVQKPEEQGQWKWRGLKQRDQPPTRHQQNRRRGRK